MWLLHQEPIDDRPDDRPEVFDRFVDKLMSMMKQIAYESSLLHSKGIDITPIAEPLSHLREKLNKKRNEYRGFGDAYGFKNLDTALGAPATIPSVMRTAPSGGGGGGKVRPSLSNIFGVPGG